MQVRFYEVTEEELEVARNDFASGKFPLQVAEEDFDFGAQLRTAQVRCSRTCGL